MESRGWILGRLQTNQEQFKGELEQIKGEPENHMCKTHQARVTDAYTESSIMGASDQVFLDLLPQHVKLHEPEFTAAVRLGFGV